MKLRRFIFVCVLLLLAMGLLGGCQKKEEAAKAEEQPATQAQPAAASMDSTAMDSTKAAQPAQ